MVQEHFSAMLVPKPHCICLTCSNNWTQISHSVNPYNWISFEISWSLPNVSEFQPFIALLFVNHNV